MGARWADTPPRRQPALLEGHDWTGTLALVIVLLMLAGAFGAAVAG